MPQAPDPIGLPDLAPARTEASPPNLPTATHPGTAKEAPPEGGATPIVPIPGLHPAGVKAKPSGRPTAGLDPSSTRQPRTTSRPPPASASTSTSNLSRPNSGPAARTSLVEADHTG